MTLVYLAEGGTIRATRPVVDGDGKNMADQMAPGFYDDPGGPPDKWKDATLLKNTRYQRFLDVVPFASPPLKVSGDALTRVESKLEYDVVGEFFGAPISTGLTIVLGKARGGKSLILRVLEHMKENTITICAGEPEPESISTLPPLMRMIESAALRQASLILVDSFKELGHLKGDGLGKEGLSREMHRFFTSLSSTLASRGVSVIAALNPILIGMDLMEPLTEALSGSIASVWRAETVHFANGKGEGVFRYTTRSGGPRDFVNVRYDVPGPLIKENKSRVEGDLATEPNVDSFVDVGGLTQTTSIWNEDQLRIAQNANER